MIKQIIDLIGLSEYPFLGVFVSVVIFCWILSATFTVIVDILSWVGGKR